MSARALKLRAALLAAPGGLTVTEMEHLLEAECDRRTVYRTLDALTESGVAMEHEGTRYRILDRKLGAKQLPFTDEEALAVMTAEDLLRPLRKAWLAGPLATARSKITAGLSPTARAWCEEQRRTARTKLLAPAELRDKAQVLDAIDDALSREHALCIAYHKPNAPAPPAPREVEPYALWYVAGRAYLVAHCRTAGEMRTFAIARIGSAEVLDESFDRDPDFDVEQFTTGSFGVYGGEPIHVQVELAAEVAHLAAERVYHPTQAAEARPDGTVMLSFEAAGLPEIAAWVASFGGKMRVMAPEALREAVAELHRGGLAANGKKTGRK